MQVVAGEQGKSGMGIQGKFGSNEKDDGDEVRS